jgi:ComF family protein
MISGQVCMYCARPIISAGACLTCSKSRPLFKQLHACLYFQTPIDQWIHAFKRQQVYPFLQGFVQLLWGKIIADVEQLPTAIIPVPQSHQRYRQRGYNPVELLAKNLAKTLGIEVIADAVCAQAQVIPQKYCSGARRKNNIKNIFRVTGRALPARIAILDDVIASGNTVRALAKVLHQSGVEDIEVWTIAKTKMMHATLQGS